MALTAEFEIGCEHLPLVEVARAVPSATIDVEMIPHADSHTPFLVFVADGSADAVEAAFESVAFVDEYAQIGAGEDTDRYKVHPRLGFEEYLGDHVDDLDGLRALATNESTIERIHVTPEGWVQSGWFATRAAFDEFREFWQGEGYRFRIRRLTATEGRYAADDVGDGLTDAQHTALETAHEMGYFEIPRTASLEDVAAQLDISASSLSERLRRAQSHLVESHVASDRREPTTVKPPKQ